VYGYETGSRILGGKLRLRVFENRVLRRIFLRTKNEATGSGENYIMRSFMICTPH